MNQKIEWYKEVLALEPGSKVFFPLARMQAENNMSEEALATLRHGLGRNPEHIEARLLLIDILFSLEQYDALWPELDQIALMLGGYPGFWSAWNARLAKNPSSRDASLALSFFSATLRGEAISWSDVIEKGLRQLLSGEINGAATESASKVAPAAIGELKSYLSNSTTATLNPVEASDSLPGDTLPGENEGLSDEDVEVESPVLLSEPVESLDELDDSEQEPDDGIFSLKTRSMAEVLAEQGDYTGALDIYEELVAHATSEEEKTSLEDAIASLNARAGMVIQVVDESSKQEQDESVPSSGQGKSRLKDVLEALAQRLEARS